MKIEVGKKYKTREGSPARVVCTDMLGNYPIVALVMNGSSETTFKYTAKGKIWTDDAESSMDLVAEYKEPFLFTLLVDKNGVIFGQEDIGGDVLFYGQYPEGYRRIKVKEVE